MEQEAAQIAGILQDYHIDRPDGFVMNPDRVIKWVSQFDEVDRLFLLKEFLHIPCNEV